MSDNIDTRAAIKLQRAILEETAPIYALIAKIHAQAGACIVKTPDGKIAVLSALSDDAKQSIKQLQGLANMATQRIVERFVCRSWIIGGK